MYKVYILKRAQKELSRVSADDFTQIYNSIRNLAKDPRPIGSIKLSGRDGWRIRIGNYRVIYEIDDKKKSVTILHVGHRQDVYR